MTRRILDLVRQQSLGFTALLVALSGTAYAAGLPRNSVGGAQLRTGAVTSVDVKDRSLLARDFRAGQLPAGAVGPRGPAALRLSWRGDVGASAPQLGTIGPWSFSATCTSTGFGGVRSALQVWRASGSSIVQITAVDSRNDTAETTFQTGGAIGNTPGDVVAADSNGTGYGRQSGMLVLDDEVRWTASAAFDLLAFSAASQEDTGECLLSGTVTLAETP